MDSNKRSSAHNFLEVRPVAFVCPEYSFFHGAFSFWPKLVKICSFKSLFVFSVLCMSACLLVFPPFKTPFSLSKKTLFFPEKSAFQEIRVSEMTSQSMQLVSCNSTRCVCGLAGLKRLRKLKKNPKAINIWMWKSSWDCKQYKLLWSDVLTHYCFIGIVICPRKWDK